MLGLALSASGCASPVGWAVREARTCELDEPAIVCSQADPDFGHTLTIGDAALLPGECARLEPDEGGREGGWIRVETRDPVAQGDRRWLRAPRSTVTIVSVDRAGHVEVVERRACDRQPFP